MLRNRLYRYGDEGGMVPTHLHVGKYIYDKMLKNKESIALINAETNERMTYEEMAQLTANVAVSLTRMGVRKGDVIAICSEKRFEVLPSIIGILCAGAVFSPSDVTYGAQPLLHRLKISRPKVMICSLAAYEAHKSTFESAGSIEHYILYGDEKQDGVVLFDDFLTDNVNLNAFQPVPVNGWEDSAFIVYSSGTTGLSKGVPWTHMAYLANCQCLVPDSFQHYTVLNARDWYYTYGLMYTIACLRVGATIVYHENQGLENMLNTIHKYKPNVLQVTPSTVSELIKSLHLNTYDLSSLEWLASSSTPIRADTEAALKARLPNLKSIVQIYGMTEAGCICNELGAPLGSRAGSSGVPCRGYVLKVVDIKTREPLGPNQMGEICVKGPSVMKAYMYNVIPDCKDPEGFLMTGDVGYYDDDGYFFIVSRIKELIKFNDVSVAPAEFEAILLQHPAVREAGVVGAPHPQHGEVPVAFVVLQPGMTATGDELVQHLETRVSYRMRLAGGVRFLERLPRGFGEKLDRKELKKMLEN